MNKNDAELINKLNNMFELKKNILDNEIWIIGIPRNESTSQEMVQVRSWLDDEIKSGLRDLCNN